MPGPFLPTLWAATLLAQLEPGPQVSQYLNSIIEGKKTASVALLEEDESWAPESAKLSLRKNGSGYQLTGLKTFVMDAATADVLLCVVRKGEELAVVALPKGTPGMTITLLPAIDATRKLYEASFKKVSVKEDQILASGSAATKALQHAILVGTIVVCAETVGAMQWVLETTVEYAKTRQQFGQTIGTFQAVQHRCADMLLYAESARSATRFAAWCLSSADVEASKAVSVAKAYCSDMGTTVCNHGVQVHGGIGFTWEHDLHLYLKRVALNEFLFGGSSYHREKIARLILD
jgi:alkylation response protein AidB-like acyl-CoA dehydrogenase